MKKRWRRAAVYVRVSKPSAKKKKKDETEEERRVREIAEIEDDEQTVEQQIKELDGFVKLNAESYVLFREKRSTLLKRVEFEAMKERVLNGEFDAVIVWKLDRLARDADELIEWRRYYRDYGFDIYSYTEPFIDLKTGMGRFLYLLFAALAEMERTNISIRTKAKLNLIGKGASYDQDRARRLASKLSVRALAKELGVSKTTAERIKRDQPKMLPGDPRVPSHRARGHP